MYTLISVTCFKSVLSSADPPGGIDNSKIAVNKCGHITLKQGKQCFFNSGSLRQVVSQESCR